MGSREIRAALFRFFDFSDEIFVAAREFIPLRFKVTAMYSVIVLCNILCLALAIVDGAYNSGEFNFLNFLILNYFFDT